MKLFINHILACRRSSALNANFKEIFSCIDTISISSDILTVNVFKSYYYQCHQKDLGGGRHPDPVCVTENNVLLKTLILFLPQDLLFSANVSQFRNCAYAEKAIFLEIEAFGLFLR